MTQTDFFDLTAIPAISLDLLRFLPVNLAMVAVALAIGTAVGLVLAVIAIARPPVITGLAALFTSFFRGTPVLVQLYLAYFAMPMLLAPVGIDIVRISPMAFVMVTLGLNQAAFLGEIFRSALSSVDRGQREAALSAGLSEYAAFRRIILPQAVVIALPGWGNATVILLHETALAFTLGVFDVMGTAQATALRTYRSLDTYLAAACIFIVISLLLEALFARMSARPRSRHSLKGVAA